MYFDASPWGGGGALRRGDQWLSYFWIAWTPEVAHILNIAIGASKHQTTWELVSLYIVLLLYATKFRDRGLAIVGDNVASLQSAISLKGRRDLSKITREIAWRRVRYGWRFAVGHIPSENNNIADCLSRLSAPGSEKRSLPAVLRHVRQVQVPDLQRVWPCLHGCSE